MNFQLFWTYRLYIPPFSAGGTLATHTCNFTSSTWQLICLALAHNQKWIYYSDSKWSWNPIWHCVRERLTPITSTASLFLHQIHITTGITPNTSLTESQPAVLQMKIKHLSAQPPGTRHPSIKQPCRTASKQTLIIMIVQSSQKNACVFFSGFSATRSHLLFKVFFSGGFCLRASEAYYFEWCYWWHIYNAVSSPGLVIHTYKGKLRTQC